MEVGIDAMYPSAHPYMFNAKIGAPEDSLFKGLPGIDAGIFDVGTFSSGPANQGRTDYNIVDFIVGKTLPLNLGRLHAAVYYGNPQALRSSTDEKANTGYMVAYDHGFLSTKDRPATSIVRLFLPQTMQAAKITSAADSASTTILRRTSACWQDRSGSMMQASTAR